jgi:hypothetical protein
MWEYPIVKEVREIRKTLSERFDFDVHAIFEDLRKNQSLTDSKRIYRQSSKNKPVVCPERDSVGLHPGR